MSRKIININDRPEELPGLIHKLDAGNIASYIGTGTTWYDLSTNDKDSTLISGVTFSTNNRSLIFNGTNQYTEGGLISNKTTNISMEAVVKIYDKTKYNQFIYYNGNSKSPTGSDGYGFTCNDDGTRINGRLNILFGSVIWITTPFFFTNNVWTHIVMILSGTNNKKVYVNGTSVLDTGTGNSYIPKTPTLKHQIGTGHHVSPNFFGGEIASVRFYDRAITSTEVTKIYNLHKK